MAFWLALAGMGANAIGAEQARGATVEGAENQAAIEKLSRDAQERRFERDKADQKPLLDVGKRNLGNYEDALKNQFDVTQSPLYKMQLKTIQSAGLSAEEEADAIEKLGGREGELAKGRLLDIQKIGLGAAGSAGKTAMNFGSAFADSMQRQGGALATATLQADQQKYNMWGQAAQDLSGYPAYAKQARYMGSKRKGGNGSSNNKPNLYTDEGQYVGEVGW